MSHQTTTDNPKRPLSEKQLAARRANAQKSTGPRTPEGKARSSQNARKHGFFTQTALLFYEAPEDFVALRDSYIDEYQPQTPTEMHCVMEMANAQFRLRRVRGMEADLIQILITRELPSRSLSNGEMQAQAFRTLADTSRALHLLQRYEVMFRRQYERALRMLWEHRDRQRELASQTTRPRRRRRTPSPDSPPPFQPDFPSPTPTALPPTLPSDFPSALAPGFPPPLGGGCIPTVPPPPSANHCPAKPAKNRKSDFTKRTETRTQTEPRGSSPKGCDQAVKNPTAPTPDVLPSRRRRAQSVASSALLVRTTLEAASLHPCPLALPNGFPLGLGRRLHPNGVPSRKPLPRNARANPKPQFCETNRNPPRPASARAQPARLQPRAKSPRGPQRGCNPPRVGGRANMQSQPCPNRALLPLPHVLGSGSRLVPHSARLLPGGRFSSGRSPGHSSGIPRRAVFEGQIPRLAVVPERCFRTCGPRRPVTRKPGSGGPSPAVHPREWAW